MYWAQKIIWLSIALHLGGGAAWAQSLDKEPNPGVIHTSEAAALREQSPQKINDRLIQQMKLVGLATRAGISHSTIRLLPESAMFFGAMGSVVAVQAFRDYAQNPVAFKQFLEHQLSPVGAFSFWTFMASQGVTSNLLSMYLKNPKFQYMIPYLGMSVGFVAQSFVSEIVSDPNVWACSKIMMGLEKPGLALTDKQKESGLSEDACSAAHEHFILSKKVSQLAPGFASMMMASVGAAVAQKILIKGATEISGVDVALWFVPGALEVKGLKIVLIDGLRIGLFVHIQSLIDRPVTLGWKNMVDSRLMMDSTVDLSREMNQMKKSQWLGSDQELKASMKDLHEKMQAWRMANLAEVYEAHSNWLQAIGQLTSMYSSSYSYYNAFINEIRNSRFNESKLKLLERASPFIGVVGKGVGGKYADQYFTSPQLVEQYQLQTIDQVISNSEKDLLGPESSGLTGGDKKEVRAILSLFKSDDLWQITKGFAALEKARSIAYQYWENDRGYIAFLNKMKRSLGDPQPAVLPGQGFNISYLLSPTNFETLKDTAYYRHVGTYTTEHITEFLMMQMICGPDLENKEGSAIKTYMGFPSVFLPPQIKEAKDTFLFCKSPFETLSNNTIYNADIQIGNKKYKGFSSYLIHEARASIVGGQKMSNFTNWWESKTEPQMKKAFESFQKSYQQIVIKMIEEVFRTDQDRLNLSPFANGTIKASGQEEKIYLSILQDLITPAPRLAFDMDRLATWSPTEPSLKSVMNQIDGLSQLLKEKVQVINSRGKKMIVSTLKTSEMTLQMNSIKVQINEISKRLGLKTKTEKSSLHLTQIQKDLASSCLDKLQDLAMEIVNYGSMANAVSWDQLNESSGTDEQKQFEEKQNQTLKKLSANKVVRSLQN